MEPFRIHVADEVLDDLRARLRHTRWPDQIPGIGWGQGTELDWLRRRVSYWPMSLTGVPGSGGSTRSTTSPGRAFTSCTSVPHRAGVCRLSSRTAGLALSSIMWTCCRCSATSTWSYPPCPGMDSRRAHPRSASIIGTSQSAGTGSWPSLGIPAMVRAVMTLGPG